METWIPDLHAIRIPRPKLIHPSSSCPGQVTVGTLAVTTSSMILLPSSSSPSSCSSSSPSSSSPASTINSGLECSSSTSLLSDSLSRWFVPLSEPVRSTNRLFLSFSLSLAPHFCQLSLLYLSPFRFIYQPIIASTYEMRFKSNASHIPLHTPATMHFILHTGERKCVCIHPPLKLSSRRVNKCASDLSVFIFHLKYIFFSHNTLSILSSTPSNVSFISMCISHIGENGENYITQVHRGAVTVTLIFFLSLSLQLRIKLLG